MSVLRNRAFAIERVFLSHGHYDHIGGLIGLIRIRGQGRGDKEKPLTIYYPEDSHGCELMQAFAARVVPKPSFHLEWIPLSAGSRVDVSEKGKGKFVETFPVEHASRGLCLGFNVCETRERLKNEYSALDEREIARIAREQGRGTITETYEKKTLSYGGDGMAVRPEYVRNTDLLIHEATFLDDGERGKEIHSTVSEAVATAVESGAGELLLAHFSTRYRVAEIFKALHAEVKRARLDIPVHVLLGSRISTLEDRDNGQGH